MRKTCAAGLNKEPSDSFCSGDLSPPTPSTSPTPYGSTPPASQHTSDQTSSTTNSLKWLQQSFAAGDSSTEDEDFVLPPSIRRRKAQPLRQESSPERTCSATGGNITPTAPVLSPFKTPSPRRRLEEGYSTPPGRRGVKREEEVTCWLDGEFMRRGVQRDKR